MVFNNDSFFLREGENSLVVEFGSEYTKYLAILNAIARGYTSKGEIDSVLNINASAYLDKLNNYFGFITKHRPVTAKVTGKIVKYKICDNYLNFFFNFIYKNSETVELQEYEYIKKLVLKQLRY